MNAEQLLQHFERISEAPDAIPRLRRFILDLAVRGRLVEQDPNDEPADELLDRIAAEKARLVKAGEIKKEKLFSPIEDADFDLPRSWSWARLGKVTSYIQRGKSPKYAVNDGSPVVSQKCVQWSGLDISVARQITFDSLVDYETTRFLRDGDLLWNSTGTGTIGRIIKVVDPPEKLVCDSHVTVVRCLEVVPDYIRAWLRSDHVYARIEDRAAGSTNQVELTAQMAINQIVPLPPLAEQHRIVAKVDELMKLCDRLAAANAEREQCRDSLVAANLQGLNQPAEEEETFREHARFTLNNLPQITTRVAHIKQLRQTILNLAVRGKLVEQDPSDEPAAELLKRIEKDRLSATEEGRFKPISGIPKEACAAGWDVPKGWVTLPLPRALYFQEGPGLRNWQFRTSGIPFLNIRTLQNGRVNRQLCQFLDAIEVQQKYQHFLVREGDILCSTSGTIGKLAIAQTEDLPLMLNTSIVRLCAYGMNGPDVGFIKLFLGTDRFLGQARKHVKGAAQVNMGPSHLKLMAFPLPPLAEQHRIVAKVDELMAICDELEAQITLTEQDSRRFLESVLAEALAPAGDLSAQPQLA